MHIGTLGMKMCLLRKRMARERNWRSRKGCENSVVLGRMITAMQAYSFKLSTNKGARQGSNERIPKFKIFLLVELRGNKLNHNHCWTAIQDTNALLKTN